MVYSESQGPVLMQPNVLATAPNLELRWGLLVLRYKSIGKVYNATHKGVLFSCHRFSSCLVGLIVQQSCSLQQYSNYRQGASVHDQQKHVCLLPVCRLATTLATYVLGLFRSFILCGCNLRQELLTSVYGFVLWISKRKAVPRT